MGKGGTGGEAGGPVPLGALMRDYLRARGLTRRSHPAGLAAAWSEAVGAGRAPSTRLAGLRAGVLTVEVSSTPLRSELETFYSEDLVERLRVLLPSCGIRKIVFRPWGRK